METCYIQFQAILTYFIVFTIVENAFFHPLLLYPLVQIVNKPMAFTKMPLKNNLNMSKRIE